MGADEDYLTHELEPSLIRLGFIAIEKAGRVLTQEGRTYINIMDGQRRAAK